jgi:hypothetical protein
MFSFERAWMVRILEGLFPRNATETFALGAADVPMRGFVDDLVRYAPPLSVVGMRAATWLIWLGPLFFVGSLRTFGGLDAERQTRMLTRMSESSLYPVREVAVLMKTIGSLGFCSLPAVQAQLGIVLDDAHAPDWAGGAP